MCHEKDLRLQRGGKKEFGNYHLEPHLSESVTLFLSLPTFPSHPKSGVNLWLSIHRLFLDCISAVHPGWSGCNPDFPKCYTCMPDKRLACERSGTTTSTIPLFMCLSRWSSSSGQRVANNLAMSFDHPLSPIPVKDRSPKRHSWCFLVSWCTMTHMQRIPPDTLVGQNISGSSSPPWTSVF